METPFNWACPFCGRDQTVGPLAHSVDAVVLGPRRSKYGSVGCQVESIACANQDCLELTTTATLHEARINHRGSLYLTGEVILQLGRNPAASRKLQPDYIPSPLVRDYYEACSILHLSPKASATLSRRCLQGMIRDFCGISKKRLIDEITQLKRQADEGKAPAGVQADIIEAIDAVRKIGNIGAHMETDINVIVDVDPDEAATLIGLLELLFREWYVARHDRKERIASIAALAATKEEMKSLPPPGYSVERKLMGQFVG
jgi:Domain of unknown function (DUF4145)